MRTPRGAPGPRRAGALNDLGIIHEGALLVRDGVLVEVGPSSRLENLAAARGALEVSAVGRLVMPGFVDSHTHLVFPPPGASSTEHAAALRAVGACSATLLAARARPHLESMARHGTTTVEVKTGCGPDASAELKVLRALAELRGIPVDVLSTVLMRLPDGLAAGELERAESIRRGAADLLPKIRNRGLATQADIQWDPDPAMYPLFVQYLEAARLLGFARKIHAGPGPPSGEVLTAVENGALSIGHLDRAEPSELSLLARSSTVATLLPCASYCEGTPPAPARTLVDGGVAVALASDFNPRHTPMLSMQAVIALACAHMGLTAAEAIVAATINGAHALGCAGRTGSLEVGKSADLLLLNISDYREMPRCLGTNLVHMTMKRGEFVYREGAVEAALSAMSRQ